MFSCERGPENDTVSQSANSPLDAKKNVSKASSYDPAPKSHLNAASIGEEYKSTVHEVNKEV